MEGKWTRENSTQNAPMALGTHGGKRSRLATIMGKPMIEIQDLPPVHAAHGRMWGASSVWILLLIPAVFLVLIAATFVFYEGRKAYWDYRVREMCEKDGGNTTYEKVNISRAQFQTWGGIGDVLGIPSESDNRKDIPFFRRSRDETLRIGNPQLVRLETDFVRRSDEKLMGKSVHYFRRDGDFPSWAHESSFGCSVPTLPIEKTIFIIEEKIK